MRKQPEMSVPINVRFLCVTLEKPAEPTHIRGKEDRTALLKPLCECTEELRQI